VEYRRGVQVKPSVARGPSDVAESAATGRWDQLGVGRWDHNWLWAHNQLSVCLSLSLSLSFSLSLSLSLSL
jgi:hypothetical protein